MVSNKKGSSSSPIGPRKGRGRPRSPARTKSPSRRVERPKSKSKSPSKKSSPPHASSTPRISPKSRSPLRRSPARRSPARKSPSKSGKSAVKAADKVRRPKSASYDSDSDYADTSAKKEKPKAAVRGRTRKVDIDVEPFKPESKIKEIVSPIIRRITRGSQSHESDRIVHLKNFDPIKKKLGEFSDEDDMFAKGGKRSQSVEKGKKITEFGGTFGALFFIVATTIGVVALHIVCNEQNCSFVKIPNITKTFSFSYYFDLKTFLGYVIYTTLLAVLSAIPFGGRKVDGIAHRYGKLTYCTNGVFCLIVLLSIIIGIEIKGIPITDFVINHIMHLLISAIIVGYIISIYAYIRSYFVPASQLNVYTVGRSGIYKFFMGREINPRVCGILDLKFYVLRLGIIGPIIFDFIYLFRSMGGINSISDLKSIYINPTLIVLVILHSIYFFDGLVCESAWVTSFEVQYEGFGFMGGVGYSVYPFMVVAVTKYVADYGIQLAIWKLALISIVFLIGFVLFRGSNNQKDAFRKNPYNPKLSHLDTISTNHGKKLICSGFWGFVRHPNYLGDIIINLSFAPFVLCVPPVITVYSIVVLLIHRAIRDNARCKQKYGSAWDRYCNRVKYAIFPKVY